jgi:thiopurine S-methyltransferase
VEPSFWHTRWEAGQIGFHQNEVQSLLSDHWTALGATEGSPIFVPLCGKSKDIGWLAGQGHGVVGVELSPLAVKDFFTEAGVTTQTSRISPFQIVSGAGVRIFCGDFFELSQTQLGPLGGVYDRAALIALPPEKRAAYAQQLITLADGAPMLLIALDYAQDAMNGPPFAVSDAEVTRLFKNHYQIECLQEVDALASEPHFAKRGLKWLTERVYRLRAIR